MSHDWRQPKLKPVQLSLFSDLPVRRKKLVARCKL
jgi:hypothetical protein